jgi:hypothetical protein
MLWKDKSIPGIEKNQVWNRVSHGPRNVLTLKVVIEFANNKQENVDQIRPIMVSSVVRFTLTGRNIIQKNFKARA